MSTLNAPTILDYDPWWFYRHAKEILDNNFRVPKWDLLSFFPPGRPSQPEQGWAYTMVIFYKIISLFSQVSFMDVAKISTLIIVALTVIPAFLLGKLLSNKWGGFTTAIFATLAPTFIGVSMAGYCDTDAPVVFFSFLSTYSMILMLKKERYYITFLL
jgi:asparagine N-glycosylation enzyme membrane subunit Stt3